MSISLKCKICKSVFTINEARKRKAKFCSYKCYWKSLKGRTLPEEQVKKMSASHKKRKHSLRELKNLEKGKKYRFTKGHKRGVGRKMSEETKDKLRKHFSKLTGEKNHNWKGGSTSKNSLLRGRKQYGRWRRDVFERDDYTCQSCKKRGVYLEVHHIKPVRDYPNLIFNVGNGITLCGYCHSIEDPFRYYEKTKNKCT